MRLVSISSLKKNVKLAKPVHNDRGQVLINQGIPLTDNMIARLKQLGITFVYIDDTYTKDVIVRPVISEKTRREAYGAIKDTFVMVQQEKELSKKFMMDRMGKRFSGVVRDILDQIKGHREAISLLSEVFSYDNYIHTHSLNVTIYTLALSVQLNQLSQRQLEEIGLGAMLHDVGKMFVPLDILMKPSKLNKEEYEIIKQHTTYGFELLRKEPSIPLVAAHCAFQHHERLNGSGYPRGLKGNDIHLYGKIMGIADVYDAVTSNRVYRRAMLPHEGLEILYAGAGSEFDQQMVEAFRKAIVIYPNGLTVHLNDNRKGVIIRQTPGLSDRPVVRVIEEGNMELENPYEVDMSKELSAVISETDTTLYGRINA